MVNRWHCLVRAKAAIDETCRRKCSRSAPSSIRRAPKKKLNEKIGLNAGKVMNEYDIFFKEFNGRVESMRIPATGHFIVSLSLHQLMILAAMVNARNNR